MVTMKYYYAKFGSDSVVSFRMILSDLERFTVIFNGMQHHAVSLRQLSFLYKILLIYIEMGGSKIQSMIFVSRQPAMLNINLTTYQNKK